MTDANTQLEKFSKELFKKFLEMNPQCGSSLGLHEYDGKISETSKEAFGKELSTLREFLQRLEEINVESLNKNNKFDYDMAKWALKSEIFEMEEMKGYEKNPMYYAFMFADLHDYISRNYAPFEERLKSAINIIKEIPSVLKNAEENLDKELPEVLCRYAKQFSLGYESFFKGELLNLIKEKISDRELLSDYENCSYHAIEAFKSYVNFLDNASSDTNESYRLGKDKFARMLKVKEEIDMSLEEIKKMGLTELERLQSELETILRENNFEDKLDTLEHDHPKEDTLIEETGNTLNELVEFINKKGIVDLPSRLNCIVTEMPKYMNFGFAAMDTAGPFEKSDESFYYVNLPEKE